MLAILIRQLALEDSGGNTADPSDDVVLKLKSYLRTIRRSTRRAQVISIAAIAFVVVAAIALLTYQYANLQETYRRASQTAAQADQLLSDDPTQLERIAIIDAFSMSFAPLLQSDIVARKVLALLPKPGVRFQISDRCSKAAIAPDLKHVACAKDDGTLSSVDTQTKQTIGEIKAGVSAFVFDPHGNGIIVGKTDGQILSYDFSLSSARNLGRLGGRVSVLASDRTGALIAAGTDDGSPSIVAQFTAGETSNTQETPKRDVVGSVPSVRPGQLKVGAVKVIRIESASQISQVSSFVATGGVRSVTFSNDSKLLAYGSDDGKLIVADPMTSSVVLDYPMGGIVGAVTFSADGEFLAVGTVNSHKASIFRMAKGGGAGIVWSGTDNGTINQIRFSPTGAVAYVGGVGNHFKSVDAATGRELWSIDTLGIWALAVAPDGRSVAAGFGSQSGLNTVQVLDAVTGTEIARESYPEYIVQLAYGDSGRHILATSFDGTIGEFEPFTTTFVARLPYSAHNVEIGNSGRYVALASIGSNRVLELENGREVLSFSRDDRNIGRVALSPDERFLASGTPSGFIALYDIAEKKLLWSVQEEGVDALEFGADGTKLVTGSKGIVSIRQAATGKTETRLSYNGMINSLKMSPNQRYIDIGEVVMGKGAGVRLIEISTRKEITKVPSDFGIVMAFSADSQLVASGSFDRRLRLTDVATGKILWTASIRVTF